MPFSSLLRVLDEEFLLFIFLRFFEMIGRLLTLEKKPSFEDKSSFIALLYKVKSPEDKIIIRRREEPTLEIWNVSITTPSISLVPTLRDQLGSVQARFRSLGFGELMSLY